MVCLISPALQLKIQQLYEDDARIGHQQFDFKLTSRVKMCMVSILVFFWSTLNSSLHPRSVENNRRPQTSPQYSTRLPPGPTVDSKPSRRS